jgi:hypothetical protein
MNSLGSFRLTRVALVILSALTVTGLLFYSFASETSTGYDAYWPKTKPANDQISRQTSVASMDAMIHASTEVYLSRTSRPSATLDQGGRTAHTLPTVVPIDFEEKGDNGDMPLSTDRYLKISTDPLPLVDFTRFKDLPPAHSEDDSGYTYATYMCNHDSDLRHPYFAAVQSLVWRVLWSTWSTTRYPMLVLVCPITPHIFRDILRGQGARVEETPFMDGPEVRLNIGRWQDMYSKLNLWNMTQYKKIVFMDVDAFPIDNIDEVFDTPTQQCNKTRLSTEDYLLLKENPEEADDYCNYLFAAVEWPDYFLGRHELNAGFLVLKPSRLMYERLISARFRTDKYAVAHLEQGLLASEEVGFGAKSAFPLQRLSRVYNVGLGNYYDEDLVMRAKVVHEKLWNKAMMLHNTHDRDTWDKDWMTMSRFYDSPAFETSRKLGFLRMNMAEQMMQLGDILYLDLLDGKERQEQMEHLERLRKEAGEKAAAEATAILAEQTQNRDESAAEFQEHASNSPSASQSAGDQASPTNAASSTNPGTPENVGHILDAR